jgi:dihydrofolate reductase
MPRIVVSEFVTLDGVMEDPGGAENLGRGGWAFWYERGDDGDRYKAEELAAADTLLLGRTTYEGFAAAWPGRTGEFADKMNGMTKVVVSTTIDEPAWGPATVIRDNVVADLGTLKDGSGADLLVAGSGRLVRTLLAHGLVDELRLMVFPVVLGEGKRLFADEAPMASWRLVEAKPVGSAGVVVLTYQPTGTDPAAETDR